MEYRHQRKENYQYEEQKSYVQKEEKEQTQEQSLVKQSDSKISKQETILPQNEKLTATSQINRIVAQPRNMAYISAIKKADEMTEQDFKILDMVQEHIENQQEQVVGEQYVDKLLYSLSKCYIEGCKVHTLFGEFIHYGEIDNSNYGLKLMSDMPERMRKGYSIYLKYPNCLNVEIYQHRICVVQQSGKVIVFEE